jgi:hypothetical protein
MDRRLAWDRSRYYKYLGSSVHQILHYHLIPQLAEVVVVTVGAVRSEAMVAVVVDVAAGACLEREGMVDSQQRLPWRRRDRLRAYLLADRIPVLFTSIKPRTQSSMS